jgi:hypothetical protein
LIHRTAGPETASQTAPACSGVFINTIPKSGTHLLIKLLELLGYTRRTDMLLNSHLGDFWPYCAPDEILSETGQFVNASYLGGTWASRISPENLFSIINTNLSSLHWPEFFAGHHLFLEATAAALAERRIRMLIIFRDPRSVAVSHAHWVMASEGHPLQRYYASLTPEQRVASSFTGFSASLEGCPGGVLPLMRRYRNMANWLDYKWAYAVRYRELVGKAGGGTDEEQYETIKKILAWLPPIEAEQDIASLAERLFGGTSTFRKGTIDAWKNFDKLFSRPEISAQVNEINALIESLIYR